TFVVAIVMMWLIKQLPHPWNLRVEANGEVGPGGLDVWEHGTDAYPDEAAVIAPVEAVKPRPQFVS
ncbi:MAG TPA: hypothetical protein VK543_12705, partial [Puia sp.]|nr:hypothetical protein [Puia sp.]